MVREFVFINNRFGKNEAKKQKKDKIILVPKPREYYASGKHGSKKQKKLLLKPWGIGLGAFASLIALGGLAVATWHIVDNNDKLTKITSGSTSIALDSTLNDYLKSYVNPDNENAVLQQDIENLETMTVTKSSLTSSEVTLADHFLAQSKMLGKGIANVNEKVESLWNNFIGSHFTKPSVSGTRVTQDAFSVASADRSALDSLSDTTGPLGISSNLFVGTTVDPKTFHVTGDTVLDSTLNVEGNTEVRGATSLLADVTVGSSTTAADLTVTGATNLLSKVTVGTSTTSADLEVTGESTVAGASSLLGDVTIGDTSTGGQTASLLVTGSTEVRGTTSLLADVTVGSTTTAADLTVTGATNLLSRVIVGTSTTPADLDVTGESTTEGVSSLLGDVTIGNTAGTAANLLVTGTTEVRGTTSLLADVTVGSTATAADLTVTGEANLLSRVTIGTSATPADLDVTGESTTEGVSSLLGDVTIGNTAGTAANLLVTGTTEVRGTTSLLADVTVGSTTTAADLTVTGATNLLSRVTIGTSTTPDDLDVTGELTTEGVSSLLGDVTIGNTAGTAANLLVTGTTEVRGTTSLLADVTVGSTTTAADLTVTGEANLLSKVNIGTIASPADLEVSRRAFVRSTSSLLGNVTIGNTTGRAANLLVTGTTEVRGSTSLLGDVTIGSGTSAAVLTVTGTTNLQGNSNIGNLGGNGVLGGNDDSTTVIKGTLNLTDAKVLGFSSNSSSGSSSEISGGSSGFNVSSLGINNGDKLNLFVKLRIFGARTNEYLQIKQVTYNNSTSTYTFEFPFVFPVYQGNSNNFSLDWIGVVERRILVSVIIRNTGIITIGTPSFRQYQIYFDPNWKNVNFNIKRGHADKNNGSVGDWISIAEERKVWNAQFGSEGSNPTYSSLLIVSKANKSN